MKRIGYIKNTGLEHDFFDKYLNLFCVIKELINTNSTRPVVNNSTIEQYIDNRFREKEGVEHSLIGFINGDTQQYIINSQDPIDSDNYNLDSLYFRDIKVTQNNEPTAFWRTIVEPFWRIVSNTALPVEQTLPTNANFLLSTNMNNQEAVTAFKRLPNSKVSLIALIINFYTIYTKNRIRYKSLLKKLLNECVKKLYNCFFVLQKGGGGDNDTFRVLNNANSNKFKQTFLKNFLLLYKFNYVNEDELQIDITDNFPYSKNLVDAIGVLTQIGCTTAGGVIDVASHGTSMGAGILLGNTIGGMIRGSFSRNAESCYKNMYSNINIKVVFSYLLENNRSEIGKLDACEKMLGFVNTDSYDNKIKQLKDKFIKLDEDYVKNVKKYYELAKIYLSFYKNIYPDDDWCVEASAEDIATFRQAPVLEQAAKDAEAASAAAEAASAEANKQMPDFEDKLQLIEICKDLLQEIKSLTQNKKISSVSLPKLADFQQLIKRNINNLFYDINNIDANTMCFNTNRGGLICYYTDINMDNSVSALKNFLDIFDRKLNENIKITENEQFGLFSQLKRERPPVSGGKNNKKTRRVRKRKTHRKPKNLRKRKTHKRRR